MHSSLRANQFAKEVARVYGEASDATAFVERAV